MTVHSLFSVSDHLPVAPGLSPFNFRGFYYDRLFARVREMPGGMPRFLAELKDERVREFAQQRFSWNGWYDALPTMPVYAAISRLDGRDITQAVRDASRVTSESLVPSILRFTMGLGGGPGVTAAVVAKLVMHTVDFAQVAFESIGPEGAIVVGRGVPLYIAPNIVGLVLGGFEGVLRTMGATDVSADYGEVMQSVRPDGHVTVSIRYAFRWRVDTQVRKVSSSSRLAAAITDRLTGQKKTGSK